MHLAPSYNITGHGLCSNLLYLAVLVSISRGTLLFMAPFLHGLHLDACEILYFISPAFSLF